VHAVPMDRVGRVQSIIGANAGGNAFWLWAPVTGRRVVAPQSGPYTYQVRAGNCYGWGPWSATKSFTVTQ
jgi:hypothetical protein